MRFLIALIIILIFFDFEIKFGGKKLERKNKKRK